MPARLVGTKLLRPMLKATGAALGLDMPAPGMLGIIWAPTLGCWGRASPGRAVRGGMPRPDIGALLPRMSGLMSGLGWAVAGKLAEHPLGMLRSMDPGIAGPAEGTGAPMAPADSHELPGGMRGAGTAEPTPESAAVALGYGLVPAPLKQKPWSMHSCSAAPLQ